MAKSRAYALSGQFPENWSGHVARRIGPALFGLSIITMQLYSASFVGYFPADQPKYSCIVIIDSPKSAAQYGGDVAAPIFRELADKAYARDLAIHKPISERVVPDKTKLPLVKAGSQDELVL